MNNITNVLTSKEKRMSGVKTNQTFLDRNLQLVYKGDLALAEESMKRILSIDSLDDVHQLYDTNEVKSSAKIVMYRKIKDDIASMEIDHKYRMKNIMFHTFALKVSTYFISLLEQSKSYTKVKCCLRNEKQFLSDLAIQFQKQVLKISYRTLVLDLNVNRENGSLAGDTKEEKYQYYNEVLLDNSVYIDKFFSQYPSLLRIIANDMRKTKKFIVELLYRFEKDKGEINLFLQLGSIDTKIDEVELGLGDAHSDGRKVSKIKVNGTTLMYKPRDLSIDQLYYDITAYINKQMKDEKYITIAPKVLNKDNYGWAEFICYEECSEHEDIKQFYTRVGCQIALLYVLNAVDFHSENIIAHGSHPVLIDLESLIHVPYESLDERTKEDAFVQAEKKLGLSVRSLGLLPFFFGEGKVDVSGIGRKGEVKSFMKIPQIRNQLADDMKVEREYIMMEGSTNHPKLNGNFVNARDYVTNIKDGFTKTYETIQQHTTPIVNFIQDNTNKLYVRFIPKPTARYSSFLELSYHPRFLHNSMDRELFLAKIWEEAKHNEQYAPLAKHEFYDLLNSDIPYFKIEVKSRNLQTSRNKLINNYFKKSPIQTVLDKIDQLSPTDLEFQLNIIELCMHATQDDRQEVLKHFAPKMPEMYTDNFQLQPILMEKAEELAEYIYSQAFKGKADNRTNYCWLNSTPVGVEEIQWNIAAMGDTLYDGLSGMAITYLSLWIATENTKYLEIAQDLIEDITSRFVNVEINDSNESYISVGAFTGVASIVYTLMIFHQYTNIEKYKEQAKQVALLIPKLLKHDKEYDIIGGSAGAISVLMRSYEQDQDPLFLEIAELCGQHIINNVMQVNPNEMSWIGIAQKPLTGFSHGNAGIIFALSLLNKYTKRDDITEIIRQGMNFENNSMIENNWVDYRKPIKESSTSAWCHGAPGILLSRLELLRSDDTDVSEQAKSDLQQALNNMFYDGFGREHSLCHGDIGNAVILIEYGREMGDAEYIRIGQNLLMESIEKAKHEGFKCGVGKDVETPNLMVGMAGIIYGILFACDERIPNILNVKFGNIQ